LPRSSKSKLVGATATLDRPSTVEATESTVTAMTDETETDEGAQFEIVSEPAPEDYRPDRKTPGRQRKPSYFDSQLRAPHVYEQGWQRVAVTSSEHRDYVVRELTRAKLYLNGPGKLDGESDIGLDLDVKDDAVYYKARLAQKRERKSNGSDALVANANDDGTYDPNGDNDE
jgi:hypothetical protein